MAATFLHSTFNLKPQLLPRTAAGRRPLPSVHRPMRIAMFDKQAYWGSINAEIEAHLEQAVPIRVPLVVHQPIRDLVLSAPRTMAPALCVAACDLVGGRRSDSLPVASALHLLFAASKAHEYLPNLLERPGPATFDANIELLSGDAIYPLAYEVVARSASDAGRVLRVIVETARSMGAQGYAQGQLMHVRWAKGDDSEDGAKDGVNNDKLRRVLEKKEGELYSCGALCGAIIGGASEEKTEKLRRYGHLVGMIYGSTGKERSDARSSEGLDWFKTSALMELQGFGEGEVRVISSILDF